MTGTLSVCFALLCLMVAPGCGEDDLPGQPATAAEAFSLQVRMEGAKGLLSQGEGGAAREAFLSICADFPGSAEARFGAVLADELLLVEVLDEALSQVLDPLTPFGQEGTEPVDAGAFITDLLENGVEPVVRDILERLESCRDATGLRFKLDWLPFRILGTEFLVLSGEYDAGDVLLQRAEFNLVAAALDTVLSADLDFDFQIVLDHVDRWAGMGTVEIVRDVLDMLLEILSDPAHPDFLRMGPDGLVRMPRAGVEMGRAMDFLDQGFRALREEVVTDRRQVTGCNDRDGSRTCDPGEFIHGMLWSLPAGLHEILGGVWQALRDSFRDGTEEDPAPGIHTPFLLDRLNPVLGYLGVPQILPPVPVDLGSLYADPDPRGIRDPLRVVLVLVRFLLEGVERLPAQARQGKGNPRDMDSGMQRGAVVREGFGVPGGPPDVGAETVSDIAALPYLRPTARTLQVSSHDPLGGNDDGFTPPNHLCVDEHGEFVLFDAFGPGCIYRMWFTHTWSLVANLRLYVDDMEQPVIEGPFPLLFASVFEPFSSPLVGNWLSASGGCFSYLPVPFEKRCKVTCNLPPEFFQFTWVRYDGDTPVRSLAGTEDTAVLRRQWNRLGEDPKAEPAGLSSAAEEAHLPPGASVVLLDRAGPGAVWRLLLGVDPLRQDVIQGLWLLARWDGHDAPDVEAPVNEFFGSFFVEDTPAGLLLGRSGERLYCYFPMPFWSGAEIGLENRGNVPVDVSWEVATTGETYGSGAGYFRAFHHEEDPVPQGRDYRIADRQGRAGKWLGLTHTLRGPLSRWYLEGDERFHVDGSSSPALHGTGTEDYYNGGWYFLMGSFSEPIFGNPSHRVFPEYDQTGTYRLHLGDAVHYLDRVRLGIQHGSDNSGTTDRYSSVAYFYERDEPLSRLSDTVDIGDPAAEAAHGYAAPGSVSTGEMTSFYEGEDDDVPVSDAGRALRDASRFLVSLDPKNAGVLLRRRYDQIEGGQRAEVRVDGHPAGTWYTPESSPVLRWAEDDFVLPPSLTAGRTNVEITIQPRGPAAWTEFFYWVYCILPQDPARGPE